MQKLFLHEPKVSFYENSYEALEATDALLLVTEWDAFRMVDLKKMKQSIYGNIIIDGRNIWNRAEFQTL